MGGLFQLSLTEWSGYSTDPEIDRVEQNDRSTAIYARLDDQLDFRRIF